MRGRQRHNRPRWPRVREYKQSIAFLICHFFEGTFEVGRSGSPNWYGGKSQRLRSIAGNIVQWGMGRIEDMRTAIFFAPGRIARSNSTVLAVMSPYRLATPVMFPAGWAKLLMKPEPIGSVDGLMTIGIVDVAR